VTLESPPKRTTTPRCSSKAIPETFRRPGEIDDWGSVVHWPVATFRTHVSPRRLPRSSRPPKTTSWLRTRSNATACSYLGPGAWLPRSDQVIV